MGIGARGFDGRASHLEREQAAGVGDLFGEVDLEMPDDPLQRSGGREGLHSEHLGNILAEMQWMQRSYQGLAW